MMGDGEYDPEYERLCYQYRHLFRGRKLGIGASWRMPDWFVNAAPVAGADCYDVAFIIPSLEQLNSMLTERIRLCQEKDVPAESILLVFDSEFQGWLLQVQLEHDYTFYGRGNSPHTAYLECIHEMSPYVVTEMDDDKRAHIFQIERKQEKRRSLEDYTRRRAEREKEGDWTRKKKFYIYCDAYGVLKSTADGNPANAIDFEEGSLEIARSLVLTQTTEIKKDTVYGPFEHEALTIPKGGLYGMY